MTEIELVWEDLPEGVRGMYCPSGDGTATIVLSAALGLEERNATLLHELEHHRRGITGDARLDERGIEDAVARQLVPADQLAAMYEIAMLNDLTVEPWQVAEKFGVPDRLAERAMRLLLKDDR